MDPLPIEVSRLITANLNTDDLFECTKVCKSWYSGLAYLFYQNIRVTSYPKRFLEQTEKPRLDGRTIGQFVRSIVFASPYLPIFEVLNKRDFCRMISNLPYLESIQFKDGVDCYIKYMESVPLNRLKYIQEVTVQGISKDIRGTHMPINIKLKDRITRLYLDDMDVILSQQKINIFEALSTFDKLTHLHIYNERTYIDNYLWSVLNACPGLVSLRFNSPSKRHPLSISNSSNKIHSNLKSLHINFGRIGISNEHLNYIMKYIPNLEELKLSPLSLRRHHQRVSVFDLTSDCAQNFHHYLKKLTYFEIEEYNESEESVLYHPRLGFNEPNGALDIQDKRFWTYLHHLLGGGYSCNLKICSHTWNNKKIVVSVNKQHKNVNIKYSIWNRDTFDVQQHHWIDATKFLLSMRIITAANT